MVPLRQRRTSEGITMRTLLVLPTLILLAIERRAMLRIARRRLAR